MSAEDVKRLRQLEQENNRAVNLANQDHLTLLPSLWEGQNPHL